MRENPSFVNGPEALPLGDGTALHILSAQEVLEAREEARRFAEEIPETALCRNACVLARAWRRQGKPVCKDGRAVLAKLSISQVQSLARRWAEFDRSYNPGFYETEERLDELKKARTCRRSACAGMCCGLFRRFRARSGCGR